MNIKWLAITTLIISIVGTINWGLIGLLNFDLVAFLFGDMSWISRINYVLVGLCGLYTITFFGNISHSETNA